MTKDEREWPVRSDAETLLRAAEMDGARRKAAEAELKKRMSSISKVVKGTTSGRQTGKRT